MTWIFNKGKNLGVINLEFLKKIHFLQELLSTLSKHTLVLEL